MDIGPWLDRLGLGEYTRAFEDNHIDDAVLVDLTDADLKTLGIVSLGHRKRVLAAIDALRSNHSETPSAPPCEPRGDTGERRQVTIVFADISGFTSISHTLDPEEVRELVERFTSTVDRIVEAYGGTVDKHIGDAVMALFGAPLAHDTDPLRAARAALDIHAALAAQSAQGMRALRAHIGIASGEVVAGTLGRGGARDYTVLGDSVNLAARLVDAAAPGTTLLADRVRQSIGDSVVCEPAGQMQFKGIDGPIAVWHLTGLASGVEPKARSRFVGRTGELEQFAGIAHACLRERAGHVIHIRGEAGIGKTRLVEEMHHHAAAHGFAFHRGLILDFGSGKAQEPVRAIVESLLGLAPSVSVDTRAARAQSAVDAGDIGAEQRVFLDDMLDVPLGGEWRTLYAALDNTARLGGKRNLIRALTRACCIRTPALIVVEDLHWADPQTVAALGACAQAVADCPALLVMTSRVEGNPIDAAWRASCRTTPVTTIDLGPLRNEDALHLAGGFLDATQRVALDCVERAGGNPLFLEQLLRNAEEGRNESVPSSIQSLVLARMDRLTPRDRTAFQAAAVVGQRFDLELVRELIGVPEYECTHLVSNALVLPDDGQYLFAHALIQEAAYSTLLRTTRRDMHRRAAAWFATSDPVLRAQHLDRAGDSEAAQAYLEAARSARRAYQPDAALRMTRRGIEVAGDVSASARHSLTCLQGDLQRDLGDIAASNQTYRAALDAAPDDPSRCRAQIGLADGLRVSEGLAEARALLDAAQQIAERHAMWSELADLHHLRGNILFPLGDVEGCHLEHERGLGYAQRTGSTEAEARALGGLADAAYAQGRMRTAFEHFSRCVSLSHEHGFGRIEVANRPMVGHSRLYLLEAREACDDSLVAVRLASMVGQPRAEMLAHTLGVFANHELCNVPAARVHLEREIALIRQLGARRFEAQHIEMQARFRMDEGANDEAIEMLEASLQICREVGMRFSAPKALGALARAVDDPARRHAALMEAESLLEQGAVAHNHFWFYRDAIEAMLDARDAQGALSYVSKLGACAQRESLPWVDLFVARGRVLARALDASPDKATISELESVGAALSEAGCVRYVPAIRHALGRT